MGLSVAVLAATFAFYPVLEAKTTKEQRVVVEISKFKFAPKTIAVKSGDVVVWKNMDIVPHSATSKKDGWDSALIPAGGEWEMTITEDMAKKYYCQFHPSMTATLNIETK